MRTNLKTIEFHITNICNLNCDNCNRLNNYHFSGHQLWKDYAEIYKQWSEKINFENIYIIGGEPTLNPSLIDWLNGLRNLWPESNIQLLTNGTRFPLIWDKLYPILLKNNISVSVHTHNRIRHSEIEQYIIDNDLIKKPYQYKFEGTLINWIDHAYNKVRGKDWPDIDSADSFHTLPEKIRKECHDVFHIDPESYLKNSNSYTIIDSNNVSIKFNYSEDFVTAPLEYTGNNQFRVYESDPSSAHAVCIMKGCHQLIRGKMYKCPHVALLPEFIDQYQVNISEDDLKLLNSYIPLTAVDSSETIDTFIEKLSYAIPQCKLCPSSLNTYSIESDTKKIKIVKKNKLNLGV